MSDPFAHLADEAPFAPPELRDVFLDDTKRGFVAIRKTAVQRPNTESFRPSMLPSFVRNSYERAFDAWLLLLALEPVLSADDPLPMGTWAQMLSVRKPCSVSAVSRAFGTLEDLGLAERTPVARHTLVRPLREDGSGETYTRPGSDRSEGGPGYFTLPYAYWRDGYADNLTLPGKVALLIGLAETTVNPSFEVATTRAEEWYGISERTLERGYLDLAANNLLLVREQSIRAKRSAVGTTTIYHRALTAPFSTQARADLQARTVSEVRTKTSPPSRRRRAAAEEES